MCGEPPRYVGKYLAKQDVGQPLQPFSVKSVRLPARICDPVTRFLPVGKIGEGLIVRTLATSVHLTMCLLDVFLLILF